MQGPAGPSEGSVSWNKKSCRLLLILDARRCFQKHSSTAVCYIYGEWAFFHGGAAWNGILYRSRKDFQRVLKGWLSSVYCAVTFRYSLCDMLHKRHLRSWRWSSDRINVTIVLHVDWLHLSSLLAWWKTTFLSRPLTSSAWTSWIRSSSGPTGPAIKKRCVFPHNCTKDMPVLLSSSQSCAFSEQQEIEGSFWSPTVCT